jgi:hypothetical protein
MPPGTHGAWLLAHIAPDVGKMGGKSVIRRRRITSSMVPNTLANDANRGAVLEAGDVDRDDSTREGTMVSHVGWNAAPTPRPEDAARCRSCRGPAV